MGDRRSKGRVGDRHEGRVCNSGGHPLLLRNPLSNMVVNLERLLDEGFQIGWFTRATEVVLDILLESSVEEPSHGVFVPIEGHL